MKLMLMAEVISTAQNSIFWCWRLYSGLLELTVEFLLKTVTKWDRVLHITWVIEIFHLFKFALCKSIIVKMGGFIRQIQPIFWCMFYGKSTKDVNLIQAESLLRDMDIYRSGSSHFTHHQSNQYLDQTDCKWKPLYKCLRLYMIF